MSSTEILNNKPMKPQENESNDDFSQFSSMYKYSGRSLEYTQEQHRQIFLQNQKEKRTNAFDEKRNLLDLFHQNDAECMEYEENSAQKRQKFINPAFRYKMMHSEWFTEIPDDLTENWIAKLCPEGNRYLIVANKGCTTCYEKNGRYAFKFRSNLPGGSPRTLGHRFSVLDCIYNKTANVNFVFDVLAWNNLSLVDVNASMRFSWLKSKFDEDPSLSETHSRKKTKFALIGGFPAQKELLQDHMFQSFTFNDVELALDGVLFYHQEGHYCFNKSPLVGWLKPFMLQEAFNIDVHPNHLVKMPDNYVCIKEFVKRKQAKQTNKRNTSIEEVEMEEAELIDENI